MKLKKISLYVLLAASFFIVNGCNKFLDILPPSSAINPTTIKEFKEILNNDSLSRVNFFMLDLMSDDVQFTDAQYALGDNYLRRTYLWEKTIWNPAQDDLMYTNTYSRILQMNIILERIKTAPSDELNTPQNRNLVISQALINRAWYYLQLVNTYGPAYDATKASTDAGVPLVLVPNTDVLSGRASVEQVYGRIISDLKTAVNNPDLTAKGSDIIHPGKAAGYGLLARAYLYKGDYDGALLYADSSLQQESRLLDLLTTTYYPGQLQDLVPNPEVLVGRFCVETGFYNIYANNGFINMSQSLLDSMGGTFTVDRRYTQKFSNKVYRLNATNARAMPFDNSVAVPEMMLIKAECLARKGDVTGASTILTTLRTKRMTAATVTGTRKYSASNILQYVLGERRRELCYRGGLRLFDLKRLNKDDRFKKDITRLSPANVLLATLTSTSPRYLMQFSPNVTASNINIVQNPR